MGYNNHSEIGWVHREHSRLINDALSIGITSPESFYDDGKVKGRSNRERGVIGQKVSESGIGNTGAIDASDGKGKSSESSVLIEETNFLSKPGLTRLPRLVKKIKATEIPRSLEGFRYNEKE